MNVSPTPPVRIGGGHCCVCSNERGGICGHTGGPFICDHHRESVDIDGVRRARDRAAAMLLERALGPAPLQSIDEALS